MTPHFLAAFNAILDGHSLPADMLSASVTMIPKPGKDPLLCGSYRPISLLNCDVKLFTKILASRLNVLLQRTVAADQVGFIQSREARDNTIRTLDIIPKAKRSRIPLLLLSTDAEKAFDRVDWVFLRETLKFVGTPYPILSWIAAMYKNPTATVRVNGHNSAPFSVSNGTRQGCPLSPLLFVLSLEPFLHHIRDNLSIKGIQTGPHQHKVAAYADDLLFYITEPLISLPSLLQELKRYGALSKFKVNLQKSEALNVSLSESTVARLRPFFPFKWANRSIQYLGTKIPTDLSKVFPLNYQPFLSTLTTDLKKCDSLALSWFGRCNVLKMNAMPSLLYLLPTLPIKIPQSYFHAVRSAFIKVIWRGRHPRLGRTLLSRPKLRGSIGFPDPALYYTVTHLARVVDWCRHDDTKLWVILEQEAAHAPLAGLTWVEKTHTTHLTAHPLIGPTLAEMDRFFSSIFTEQFPFPNDTTCGTPRVHTWPH